MRKSKILIQKGERFTLDELEDLLLYMPLKNEKIDGEEISVAAYPFVIEIRLANKSDLKEVKGG